MAVIIEVMDKNFENKANFIILEIITPQVIVLFKLDYYKVIISNFKISSIRGIE